MPNYASTTKLQKIWQKFSNKNFRESFVASHLSSNIANQIATMREDCGWTQEQLAAASGMKQSRISALEDPSLKSVTLRTLKRIAGAFDVAVVVRFVRYSDVARWAADPSPDQISVPPFNRDRLRESAPVQINFIVVASGKFLSWTNRIPAQSIAIPFDMSGGDEHVVKLPDALLPKLPVIASSNLLN